MTLPANPSVLPGAGDLVVASPDDVLAVAPGFVKQAQGQPAPVRDALVLSLEAVQERYQELSGYAAAQCDILRATDQYLVGLAEDRQFQQQDGEDQEAFRARILATPSQVSPEAIAAAVNAVLAPLTSVECQYLESVLDRWFITDGTASFHSFQVGLPGASPGDASPSYPDRYYRDDAISGAANTAAIPNRDPGGAWVFSDVIGRYFIVRVPVVADTATSLIYPGTAAFQGPNDTTYAELGGAEAGATESNGSVITEPAPSGGNLATTAGGRGFFLGDGTDASGSESDGSVALFLFRGAQSALSTYQAMVNAVERIKGQSIRWMLYVDQNLVA